MWWSICRQLRYCIGRVLSDRTCSHLKKLKIIRLSTETEIYSCHLWTNRTSSSLNWLQLNSTLSAKAPLIFILFSESKCLQTQIQVHHPQAYPKLGCPQLLAKYRTENLPEQSYLSTLLGFDHSCKEIGFDE